MNWNNRKVLVVGMARSGIAAAVALADMGADVTINDTLPANKLEGLEALGGLSVRRMLGVPAINMIYGIQDIVISPGVPIESAFIREARGAGIHVIAELELGFTLCPCPVAAITGTNGKTTVTAWVGEMVQEGGVTAHTAGNIGLPATQAALEAKPDDCMILEVSSYQLEGVETFRPKVSAILNLAEDHLARHQTMERDLEVKARIFQHQRENDIVILNADDARIFSLKELPFCRVWLFSRKRNVQDGVCLEGDTLVFRQSGETVERLVKAGEISLPGLHNLENAMAAAAVALGMGIAPDAVRRSLIRFRGVEHRLETVCTVRGVTFVNDSKATNVDSALVAIASMKQRFVLILGGSPKVTDYRPLIRAFTPQMKQAVIVGETADEIIKACDMEGFDRWVRGADFTDAVYKAFDLADSGEVVLLSPACASFDAFKDFEHRGRVFKEIVEKLRQENS